MAQQPENSPPLAAIVDNFFSALWTLLKTFQLVCTFIFVAKHVFLQIQDGRR
jgi:hypothetical protein